MLLSVGKSKWEGPGGFLRKFVEVLAKRVIRVYMCAFYCSTTTYENNKFFIVG